MESDQGGRTHRHLEDGNPETNRKINIDVPTLLGCSQVSGRSRRYLV
jgi:hypothetical protein